MPERPRETCACACLSYRLVPGGGHDDHQNKGLGPNPDRLRGDGQEATVDGGTFGWHVRQGPGCAECQHRAVPSCPRVHTSEARSHAMSLSQARRQTSTIDGTTWSTWLQERGMGAPSDHRKVAPGGRHAWIESCDRFASEAAGNWPSVGSSGTRGPAARADVVPTRRLERKWPAVPAATATGTGRTVRVEPDIARGDRASGTVPNDRLVDAHRAVLDQLGGMTRNGGRRPQAVADHPVGTKA